MFPRGHQYTSGQPLPPGYEEYRTHDRHIRIITGPAGNDSKGLVILAHPYVADAGLFFMHAGHSKIYETLQYRVVIFDFNGFGESPFSDFNFDLDIQDVYHWTRNMFGDCPIVFHGISFGASQILRATSKHVLPGDLAIIENCLDKDIHYFKVRSKKKYRFLKLIQWLRPSVRKEGDFTGLIQQVGHVRAIAFIYGKDDRLTTIDMGLKLQKNCPLPNAMLIYEGKHLQAIEEKNMYTSFLQNMLPRTK